MPRPKKIENSRSRSFLLPDDLLARLEEAAEMRRKAVSDVVREILEAHAGAYRRESAQIKRERLERVVEAVAGDRVLAPLFAKHRGMKNLETTSGAHLKETQLMRLLEALIADSELGKDPAGPDEGLHPVLRELAERVPARYGDLVRGLDTLIWARLSVEKEGDEVRFAVRPEMAEMLRQAVCDDPAVEGFRKLIDKGLLQRDGYRNDTPLFRVTSKARTG
jgi:hypothetical protein